MGRVAIAGAACAEAAVITTDAARFKFWSRLHLLIESTLALEHPLPHPGIGDDLPGSLFQAPAPAPACFLYFGKVFQDGVVPAPVRLQSGKRELTGGYVFNGRSQDARSIWRASFTYPRSRHLLYARNRADIP